MVLRQRGDELALFGALFEGLSHGALVFDVGANHGDMTDIFLRLGARVIAIEPDESNQQVLRRKFHAFRFRRLPVLVLPVAVAEAEGTETFWVDEPGSAQNTLSRKWVDALKSDSARFGHRLTFVGQKRVSTTSLERVIAEYGEPCFIKIDVEGAEVRVLRGLRRPVRLLSFEVNLPEFREEGLECVALLKRLGPTSRFNYVRHAKLVLDRWVVADEFASVLSACEEPSIDVLWRGK
jgi:FkbM family methyltransferase